MEPKPREFESEIKPLTIDLSQRHLDNLQNYITQARTYIETNSVFILGEDTQQSGFAQTIKDTIRTADYHQKSFQGALDLLKSGGTIQVRRINAGDGLHMSVAHELGDEFYYAFMAGLFGQDENGIDGEEFGKIHATVRRKREIFLKFKGENFQEGESPTARV